MKKFFTLAFVLTSLSSFAQIPQYGSYEIYHEITGGGYTHGGIVFFDNFPYWDLSTPITNGWDNCCEAQLIIGNQNQPYLYTRVLAGAPEPPTNPRLVVNALPLLTTAVDVPMGLVVGTAGTYSLKFTRHWTFPAGTEIILEDLKTSTNTNLNTDSILTITTALADSPDRFVIHINPMATSVVDATPETQIRIANNSVFVEMPEKGSVISVHDLSGRVIASETESEGKLEVSLHKVPSGIYVISYVGPLGSSSVKMVR